MARNLRQLLSLPVFQEDTFGKKQQNKTKEKKTPKNKSQPVLTYRKTGSLVRVQGKEEKKSTELWHRQHNQTMLS